MRRQIRRTCPAVIALTLLLSGCSGPQTQDWSGADAFGLATVDGEKYVFGVDATSQTVMLATKLEGSNQEGISDSTLLRDGDGMSVLTYVAAEGARGYVSLAPSTQTVSPLTGPADLGLVAMRGANLLGVPPQLDGPRLIHVDLRSGAEISSQDLSVLPTVLAADRSQALLVGTTQSSGSVIQVMPSDGAAADPVVAADNALPGGAAIRNGLTVIALSKLVPDGASATAKAEFPDDERLAVVQGERVRYLKAPSAPWAIAFVDDDTVAVDGDAEGGRVVWLINLTTGKGERQIKLPDTRNVLGMAVAEGVLMILQREQATFAPLAGGEVTTVDLPGTTDTTWNMNS